MAGGMFAFFPKRVTEGDAFHELSLPARGALLSLYAFTHPWGRMLWTEGSWRRRAQFGVRTDVTSELIAYGFVQLYVVDGQPALALTRYDEDAPALLLKRRPACDLPGPDDPTATPYAEWDEAVSTLRRQRVDTPSTERRPSDVDAVSTERRQTVDTVSTEPGDPPAEPPGVVSTERRHAVDNVSTLARTRKQSRAEQSRVHTQTRARTRETPLAGYPDETHEAARIWLERLATIRRHWGGVTHAGRTWDVEAADPANEGVAELAAKSPEAFTACAVAMANKQGGWGKGIGGGPEAYLRRIMANWVAPEKRRPVEKRALSVTGSNPLPAPGAHLLGQRGELEHHYEDCDMFGPNAPVIP